jgi:transposase
MRCIPTDAQGITLGVDTHKDFHVAVALDALGRRLGTLSIPTTRSGYEKLAEWANGFGPLESVGIEGTGSFGAGLTRFFLRAEGRRVFEVDRPRRRDQYRCGKSDPIDAELAARAVLAGTATTQPKDADGEVEMIRTLRVTRRCAVKARAQAVNQLKNLLITAPEGLRSELCGGSPQRSWSRRSRGFGRAQIPRTWRRPPNSPCAR